MMPKRRPEVAEASLENAFMNLLYTFFDLTPEDQHRLVTRIRKTYSGTQFGHDIEFDATVKGEKYKLPDRVQKL